MRVRAVKIFSISNVLVQAAPLLVLLLAHQHLGQEVPGIEVRTPSSKELAKVRFNKLTKVRRCTEPPWLPTPRQRGGSRSKRGGSRG